MSEVSVRGKVYARNKTDAKKYAAQLRKQGMTATIGPRQPNLKNKRGHAMHSYTVYYYRGEF